MPSLSRRASAEGRRSRLRHFVTTALALACAAGAAWAAPARPAHAATRLAVSQVKEVNYYPRSGGWAQMWTDWRPDEIDSDMARIGSLRANTVRVIVNGPVFGDQLQQAVMLGRLHWIIGDAASHGLSVHLTLFDGYVLLPSIPDSQRWVDAVLGAVRGDSRIALVELINERPWPTFQGDVVWARYMLPYVRGADGGIPVAVSLPIERPDPGAYWITLLQHELLTSQPDVWDIHYYGDPTQARVTLSAWKAAAAPRQLIVGETGQGTDGSAASESDQSSYLWTVDVAAASVNLPAPAPWMLYDLPGTQKMGLYRADGSAKPAAATEQYMFSVWRWPQ